MAWLVGLAALTILTGYALVLHRHTPRGYTIVAVERPKEYSTK